MNTENDLPEELDKRVKAFVDKNLNQEEENSTSKENNKAPVEDSTLNKKEKEKEEKSIQIAAMFRKLLEG